MIMFRGQFTDPFIGGRGDTAASAPVGASSSADGGVTSRLFGTAAGADYRFLAYKLAGFALAGGGANFSAANGGMDDPVCLLHPQPRRQRVRTLRVVGFTTDQRLHAKACCDAHDHALKPISPQSKDRTVWTTR